MGEEAAVRPGKGSRVRQRGHSREGTRTVYSGISGTMAVLQQLGQELHVGQPSGPELQMPVALFVPHPLRLHPSPHPTDFLPPAVTFRFAVELGCKPAEQLLGHCGGSGDMPGFQEGLSLPRPCPLVEVPAVGIHTAHQEAGPTCGTKAEIQLEQPPLGSVGADHLIEGPGQPLVLSRFTIRKKIDEIEVRAEVELPAAQPSQPDNRKRPGIRQ